MPRRTFALAVLAVLLAVPAGAAPTPEGGYRIKTRESAKGDVTLVENEESDNFSMKILSSDGQVIKDEKKKTKVMVGADSDTKEAVKAGKPKTVANGKTADKEAAKTAGNGKSAKEKPPVLDADLDVVVIMLAVDV